MALMATIACGRPRRSAAMQAPYSRRSRTNRSGDQVAASASRSGIMCRVVQFRAGLLHEGNAIRPGPRPQLGIDVAQWPVETSREVAEACPLDGRREEAGRGDGDLVAGPFEGLGEGDQRMEMAIPGGATEEDPHRGAFPVDATGAIVARRVSSRHAPRRDSARGPQCRGAASITCTGDAVGVMPTRSNPARPATPHVGRRPFLAARGPDQHEEIEQPGERWFVVGWQHQFHQK